MQELKNIGKSYNKSIIFKNINLSVKNSEPIILMGKNGCGKSTLLKIMAGIIKPTTGELSSPPKIKISLTPDKLPPMPFKTLEYLRHMGKIQGLLTGEINEYITKMFDYFYIPHHVKEQKLNKCSKGELQKINIMQALITKPDLLLMDEPFSGLDEDSLSQLLNLLTKTSENQTAIVIACHEKEIAQKFSNIYVFKDQLLNKQEGGEL